MPTPDRSPPLLLRASYWLGAIILPGAMVVGLFYCVGRDGAPPRLPLAYYPGINELVEEGEYQRALDQVDVACHLDFLSRGRISVEIKRISDLSLQRGQLDDHIRASNLLIGLGADDEETSLNLSGSLLRRGASGDYRQAEKLCRELLQKDRNSSKVNCNLGAALLYQDRLDEAEQYFQRALGLDPGLFEARRGLARIQELRGSHE